MAQVLKRTTASGARYDVRTRINGAVRTKSFRSRKEANAYAATIEADKVRGVVVDPRGARTPLREIATRWLASKASKRRSSLARDRSIVDNHINPALGNRAVGSITKADVQAVVDAWTTKLSPSTVRRQYTCLQAIFTFAEADEKIARTPCRGIRLPQVRLVERPELSADDLDRLASALGPSADTFMWLAVALGLRWGEVAELTVDRLDFLAGTVRIDRQLTRNGELVSTKSEAGVRTLAAPAWLMDDLRSYSGLAP